MLNRTYYDRDVVASIKTILSMPANTFIREFLATKYLSGWQVNAITMCDQIITIHDKNANPLLFKTLDDVASFFAANGIS